MRVAVAGGTGQVGRHVVTALRAAGHEPAVVARSLGVDVTTGDSLDAALDGAEAVLDVTSTATLSTRKSVAFFEAGTRHLLAAGERAGVGHHVVLSVVGCDRVGLGHYRGKQRQEELVAAGPLGWSVLRATQFHEFAERFLAGVPVPLTAVPRMRCQPVAAAEVAEALVALATGSPVGHAPELAGPREEQLVDMVRRLALARGRRRPVVPVRLPGRSGRAMAGGALLPIGPGPRGRRTFEQWCRENVPSR